MNTRTIARYLAYAIVILIGIGIWVGLSAIEARAYTRVTGRDVSTLDAMFLQLRVTSDGK